jgi:ABC-type multidrug transport system ATPase subunit
MSDGGETVLSLSSVRRSFGDVSVLEGVSLDLRRGSVAAVVGPNGSGKTTFARIAAGLLPPTGGTVEFPARDSDPDARWIAYLPQRPAFRPGFSVRETLAFYAALAGEPTGDDAVVARLERVGLADAADRRVEALSGGMVRLLGLAVAAVGDPALVVLDEPTSGLDPALSRRVFDRVTALADDGRAVLVASHDLTSVGEAADEVAVLDRGTFRARGSAAEVCETTGTETLVDAFTVLVDRGEAVARTGVDRRTDDGAGEEAAAGPADGGGTEQPADDADGGEASRAPGAGGDGE